MTLHLDLPDDVATALRSTAEVHGMSVEALAERILCDYAASRLSRLQAAVDQVVTEDAELLRRLGD